MKLKLWLKLREVKKAIAKRVAPEINNLVKHNTQHGNQQIDTEKLGIPDLHNPDPTKKTPDISYQEPPRKTHS